MRVQAAGRSAVMILLNARESVARTADAVTMHRMLRGEPVMEASVTPKRKAGRSTKHARRGSRTLVAQL
jgi:D-alanyl-D-alanine carboxypeptidase/D-alanyl-D-alanine endopeptidase (penicillin-binding protein 7)